MSGCSSVFLCLAVVMCLFLAVISVPGSHLSVCVRQSSVCLCLAVVCVFVSGSRLCACIWQSSVCLCLAVVCVSVSGSCLGVCVCSRQCVCVWQSFEYPSVCVWQSSVCLRVAVIGVSVSGMLSLWSCQCLVVFCVFVSGNCLYAFGNCLFFVSGSRICACVWQSSVCLSVSGHRLCACVLYSVRPCGSSFSSFWGRGHFQESQGKEQGQESPKVLFDPLPFSSRSSIVPVCGIALVY